MENIVDWFTDLTKTMISMMIALARFAFLIPAFIFSGVHIILFTRTEICNVEMRGQPFRCDRENMNDKLAFLDKICLDNPELLNISEDDDVFSTEIHPDEGDEDEDEGI